MKSAKGEASEKGFRVIIDAICALDAIKKSQGHDVLLIGFRLTLLWSDLFDFYSTTLSLFVALKTV